MITVKYNGVDITSSVSVRKCWHDMYAKGQSDTLFIRFNDPLRRWDRWQPQPGDVVSVESGTAKSGAMFITKLEPANGSYTLRAQAMPQSAKDARGKTWQNVWFTQLCQEIAQRHGLELQTYGVDDWLYSYVMQSGEGDFSFLQRRCNLEGCAFLVYDKKLVVYSERYMEGIKPTETLQVLDDTDYCYTDDRAELYGTCAVDFGRFQGAASADNGGSREYTPIIDAAADSQEDADRFAANLLRQANQMAINGFVRFPVLGGYAAGSTATITNDRAPSFNGGVFLHHVRNDYAARSCKLFFRKIEGV